MPSGAGEQAREGRPPKTTPRKGLPYVFVLDRHGTPLQPTHPARARQLLAKGRAIVARHTPFVIRLKDRTTAESEVDGVETGIDPGSKRTGIAVFTDRHGERRGRYAIRLDHRGGQIAKRMRQRAAYRKGRRSRNLRYRTARFDNRTRPRGWLPPSLRHRVDTTLAWVGRLARWAPVRAVHVERIAFDVHALDALAVGRVEAITTAVSTVLVVGATGRGSYARTRADRHGFPRLRLPRRKRFFGFRTGDLARAAVPSGMNAGTHTGRVAVRSSGSHTLQTSHGPIKTSWKNLCLLQRADGYGYTTQKEAGAPSTA
ncbi:RNA-guided endonuclease IscB [Nocardiopsis dassonvillei]